MSEIVIFMTFPPLLQGKKARRPFERANSTTRFAALWKRSETALEGAWRDGLAKVASIRKRKRPGGQRRPLGGQILEMVQRKAKTSRNLSTKFLGRSPESSMTSNYSWNQRSIELNPSAEDGGRRADLAIMPDRSRLVVLREAGGIFEVLE